MKETHMTSPHFSRRSLLGLGLGGTLGLATGAYAQEARAVRVVLPVSAGSGVDTIARSASVALGRAFGQPVVIENLPGAGGVIGASAIAKAAPDGFTLGFVSNNHVINPAIYKKMPFAADPQTPTVAEQGLPNFAVEGWFAFIGPARMSAADTQRVHKAIVTAFQSPEVLESMAKAGTQIKPSSPADAQRFFRAEADRYARLAQMAGVTLQ
jgi:tripartite-type tricarboxylate transporter receptor subunit TctC